MSATQTFFVEHLETPTGRMRLVSDDAQRLRAIDWDDCEARMQDLLLRYYGPSAVTLREASRPSHAAHAVAAYFDGDLDAIADLATETNGTPFQHTVWAALRRIPAGRTTSYSALAAAIGQPEGDTRGRIGEWRQSHRHRCAVPSGDRRKRVVDRLWRRDPSQALAACA
jgi:O6-methylguanine-DNA--protein-cysteine methyltransferase